MSKSAGVTEAFVRNRYPWMNDEQVKRVLLLKSRLLNKQEQAEYIRLVSLGHMKNDVVKQLKISNSAVLLTRDMVPGFASALDEATKTRTRRTESVLHRWMNGELTKTTTTYMPKLDDNKQPVYDKEGKQIFYVAKKEVVQCPPDATLIQFYLRAHKPDVYNVTKQDSTSMLPTEELKHKVIGLFAAK